MSADRITEASAQVDITCEGLATLLESARKVGTVSHWIALALEWSAKADAEIRRQRVRIAELESSATAEKDASQKAGFEADDIIIGLRKTLTAAHSEVLAAHARADDWHQRASQMLVDLTALQQSLTATQHVRDGLNAACGQWKEAFDAKDAALQQARSALTASEKPWVRCADRMPDTWLNALVWDGTEIWQALYQLKDGGTDGRKAGKWYEEKDGFALTGISHWMPQPKGPA